jgi:hypothetical protein
MNGKSILSCARQTRFAMSRSSPFAARINELCSRTQSTSSSDDPQFEEKAADIIGLYLNSPENAAVFCVDEKSAIQALDRLDRRLPLFNSADEWPATCPHHSRRETT